MSHRLPNNPRRLSVWRQRVSSAASTAYPADAKNLLFLTEECWFHEWTICFYKDDMLKDSLKSGYPKDTAVKALGIWTALLSGGDLFAERTPAEIDDKIFMMRPYVFAPHYELMYGAWEHKRLPLCKPGCTEHPPMAGYAAPYERFGHKHMRAPPHFVLGAYLLFIRLLDRQPARVGLKKGSTSFQGNVGRGLFSITHIMPSLYHDTEWQRNTVCQDPHTSPGLPPLTFHGRIQGFWRGNLLFFDFDAYRQMLSGNMRALYTGTFVKHAVELDIKETVIRVRHEDVGGKGSILNCGFADEETEEEQAQILAGYGHEVLTGDAVYAHEPPGWTKEILLSGMCRSGWGWSRLRGRIRAWDGLVTLSVGAAVSLDTLLVLTLVSVPVWTVGMARIHPHWWSLDRPMARLLCERLAARVRRPIWLPARRRCLLPSTFPHKHEVFGGSQRRRGPQRCCRWYCTWSSSRGKHPLPSGSVASLDQLTSGSVTSGRSIDTLWAPRTLAYTLASLRLWPVGLLCSFGPLGALGALCSFGVLAQWVFACVSRSYAE